MNGIHRFSNLVIDYAERLSDVADAAQGKHRRGAGGMRWLVLPAAGAGALALVKSDFFERQAKAAVQETKTRVSDLPDELLDHVRQTSQSSRTASARRTASGARGTTTTSSRKRSSTRKGGSARKSTTPAR
jgi:hypothetical protein